VHVAWVHDVVPHSEYAVPGVALRVSWMDDEAQVTAKILWVPMPGVADLRKALRKLDSRQLQREMARLGADTGKGRRLAEKDDEG
jgi:hypothetical protein